MRTGSKWKRTIERSLIFKVVGLALGGGGRVGVWSVYKGWDPEEQGLRCAR